MKDSDAPRRPAAFLKLGLIRRMAGFLSPHRRPVIIASLLIPLCIGLELSLPVITRTAIDRYLVPYHMHIHLDRLDTSLQETFYKALHQGEIPQKAKKENTNKESTNKKSTNKGIADKICSLRNRTGVTWIRPLPPGSGRAAGLMSRGTMSHRQLRKMNPWPTGIPGVSVAQDQISSLRKKICKFLKEKT